MDRKIISILLLATLLFACEKPPQETEKEKGEGKETVIPVSSVTLNKAEITLVEGEEETLVATVKPDNAKDKSVVWESTDAKVASVNNEGKVTAILEGSATISAKSGTVSATCQVKVNPKQMEILGLETLKSMTFRVDEPVNLVQGLSVTRGGSITRIVVKEDGVETELEGNSYVPEFPVESLAFTFTAESPDGKQNATATVEGLTVLPLEYNPVNPAPANLGKNWDDWKKTVTAGNRQWYEYYETVGLLQTKKVLEQLDLMAPEGRKEKLEHIKLVGGGEYPTGDHPWIEGVWESPKSGLAEGFQHADIMTEKIKTSDNSANKGIAQSYPGKILWGVSTYASRWEIFLQYSKENPDTKFIFFTADDWVGGAGEEYNPKGTKEGNALEELVNSPNTFIIAAISNVSSFRDFGLESNHPWVERSEYNTTSIQGNHSIAAIGGNLTETKFRDYEFYPYEHSVFPIGYEQKNLKISSGGYPAHEGTLLASSQSEASSWPTAELAATMWNILALDPDMSFDDLMDLINTYKILIPASHNGKKIQDFDTPDQKEICRQICLPKSPEGLSSEASTELPRESKYPAVLWTGPGVEYNIGGEWKSLTAEDFQDGRGIFESAAKATFRFNPVLWKKMGGKGTVNLKVMAITTDGETIPEVEREVSYSL